MVIKCEVAHLVVAHRPATGAQSSCYQLSSCDSDRHHRHSIIVVMLSSSCDLDIRIVINDSSSFYHHVVSSRLLTRKHTRMARTPLNTAGTNARPTSPRNPRFPIYRLCLQTTFHVRMSIFKSGISGVLPRQDDGCHAFLWKNSSWYHHLVISTHGHVSCVFDCSTSTCI